MQEDYILKKIKERIHVAVEFDGYDSANPISAYDAHEDYGLLLKYYEFQKQISELSELNSNNAYFLSGVIEQNNKIEHFLKSYVKVLNNAAKILNTDVNLVSDKVFDSLAKKFEVKNKEILRIVSPTPWFG